jgi:transcriptional antiterminator NusG
VLLPREKVVEMRRGVRKVRERNLYPGYLFLECADWPSHDLQAAVRDLESVTGFAGGAAPHRLPREEVERMLQRGGAAPRDVPPACNLVPGERVKVRSGVFATLEGTVEQVHEAKLTVVVSLQVFGRETRVELEAGAVESA